MLAESEALAVDEWQQQMMHALGLTDAESIDVIGAGHDWHDVKALLDAGCDRETAVRILT